jgi:hypothetical protein
MSDISLEIHHLDVRGGDATAVIVKDLAQETATGGKTLYRMLIDAGAEGKGSAALKSYLETYLPGEFDCIVATHFHQDHIQGFPNASIKFKKFLDNGSYKDGNGSLFVPKNGIGKGARTTLFSAYTAHAQKKDSTGTFRQRIPIPFIESGFAGAATPLEIELGTGTGIKLICYAANGILANGRDVLSQQKGARGRLAGPNDVSLALVFEWGTFRYFTAGDLSGDRSQNSYYDIEQRLVNYLTGIGGPLENRPISVLKASHHGSEHSNHLEMLQKLKPETIVVCCNIQKQVPSPIFLQRLKTYFDNATDSIVVFTNSMKVFRADDRYAPLLAIKDFIAEFNVEFVDQGKEKFASNLGIKCAVIRRRVLDGNAVDFADMPDRSYTMINRTGYELLLMDRDANDEQNVAETVKFRSFDIQRSWEIKDATEAMIKKGFDEQAKAIANWLKHDQENGETIGNNYVNEYYPGLRRTMDELTEADFGNDATGASKLSANMLAMFKDSFKISGRFFQPKASTLSSDEKMTLNNLLVDNYYQPQFNYAIKFYNWKKGLGKKMFDRDRTWNRVYAPEPAYGGGLKRPAGDHLPEDLSATKKVKAGGNGDGDGV